MSEQLKRVKVSEYDAQTFIERVEALVNKGYTLDPKSVFFSNGVSLKVSDFILKEDIADNTDKDVNVDDTDKDDLEVGYETFNVDLASIANDSSDDSDENSEVTEEVVQHPLRKSIQGAKSKKDLVEVLTNFGLEWLDLTLSKNKLKEAALGTIDSEG